jgi:drug/metabolite transporter (DMT)-like permease
MVIFMDRDWLIVILVGAAFGSALYFNAILLEDLGPITVSFARVGTAAVASWVFIFLTWRSAKIPVKQIVPLAILGIFTFAIPLLAYPLGQQYLGAGMTGIVNAMTPAMTVAVSQFWPGGERVNAMKVAGVVTGIIGIVLLMAPALGSGGQTEVRGILIILLAPFGFAVSFNLIRTISGVSSVVMATWAFTSGAVVVGTAMLMLEGVPVVPDTRAWGQIAIVGVLLTAVTYQIAFAILPRAGALKVASLTYIAPVSAVTLGAVYLGERLTMVHFIGMIVIFAGLVLIDRGRLLERAKQGAK